MTFAQTKVKSEEIPLSDEERRLVVEQISKEVIDNYIFPKVAQKSAIFIQQQLKSGHYEMILSAKKFAEKLTLDLQSISHDKHMRVRAGGGRMMRRVGGDQTMAKLKRERKAQENNYGLGKTEILAGNVGYLNLNSFMYAGVKAEEKAAAALEYLSDSDAIILDMRENGGGMGFQANFIASYFLPEKTQLNSILWREGNKMMDSWTTDILPEKRMLDVPLYLLTADNTFSAAESFVYNLKIRERATTVGETTGGGANPGRPIQINKRFSIFVSNGRAINPITNSNWEGTGVAADVKVSADEAFDTAYKLAKVSASEFKQKDIEHKVVLYKALEKGLDDAKKLVSDNNEKAKKITNKVLSKAMEESLVDEASINQLGYKYLMQSKNPAMAVLVMNFNASAFPQSANAYDSLAEAYLALGNKELSDKNYAMSRKLNSTASK